LIIMMMYMNLLNSKWNT